MYNELLDIFTSANNTFLTEELDLFNSKVSERTLCGALMLHLNEQIKSTIYSTYKVDVEYNRNKGGKVKTINKTMRGPEESIVTINCDLILHSRGRSTIQDNLIAVEMKKSTRPKKEKDKDRDRLVALTKSKYDDIWSYDGVSLPEHVCGYILGVYYEVNTSKRIINLEYYESGHLVDNVIIKY